MRTILCSVPTENPGAELRRPRSESNSGIDPKIAITQLNHFTEKNGFPTCKFYDIDMLYPNDEDVIKYFKENKADIVGLSAVVSTSYRQVKRIAKIIKDIKKDTLIVCGGYMTAAANAILQKTDVDICVVGDGEVAWVGILNFMKDHLESRNNKFDIDKLLEVKGIAILDDNNNLKFSGYGQRVASCHMHTPSFEYLKSGLQGDEKALQNYFRHFKRHDAFRIDPRSYEKGRKPMSMSLFTSKGCVAKCTFCQRGSLGYLTYDLDKMEEHLKHCRDKYDIGFLTITDENFGSNKKYTYQLAELFNKYNMLWFACGVRCTSVNKEDLIHYQKNGCSGLQYGIETGSQTMLDLMEKKFTVDDIKKALIASKEIGLYSPPTGYMIGMPGENLKTIRETGKFMAEVSALLRVPPSLLFKHSDICYALPLVGTPLYEYGKELGLVGHDVKSEEEFLETVSDVSYHKRYFINFNGAPMSEVVFWDMLVFLESTREYTKLMKDKEEDKEMIEKFVSVYEVQGLNPRTFAKYKKKTFMKWFEINQYFFTKFLREKIIFNKSISKLPRFIIEPIVRYGLYFEYLLQKFILKDTHNLFSDINQKVSSKMRITEEELDPKKTTQRERSLRSIVNKRKLKNSYTEEQKLLSTLHAGP